MKRSPASRPSPAGATYLFPLPLDCADVFQVASNNYQRRWFGSKVCVPTGVWSWADGPILRRYAKRLVHHLKLGRHFDAELVIAQGRYLLKGTGVADGPTGITLPVCAPVDLDHALSGLASRARGNEMIVVQWLEYFQAQAPEALQAALFKMPKLQDLLR